MKQINNLLINDPLGWRIRKSYNSYYIYDALNISLERGVGMLELVEVKTESMTIVLGFFESRIVSYNIDRMKRIHIRNKLMK